ncbi:hypothetical protein, partial [Burkholderia pseudomallei]
SGIVQLKQPRPFSKIEMARRNQAGQGAIKTSWQFKFQAIQIESRASWMTGLGKILGVVGGVVGGVFAVKDSYEMRERHPVFAIAMLTLGTFSIAAFFACVFGDGWGGVCFGIGDCNNYFRCCAI